MVDTSKGQSRLPKTASFSDVVTGLIIFLAINFLVAAMYFHIINP